MGEMVTPPDPLSVPFCVSPEPEEGEITVELPEWMVQCPGVANTESSVARFSSPSGSTMKIFVVFSGQ